MPPAQEGLLRGWAAAGLARPGYQYPTDRGYSHLTQGEGGTPALRRPQPALRTSARGEVLLGPAWSRSCTGRCLAVTRAREPCCRQGQRAWPRPWGSPGPFDCGPSSPGGTWASRGQLHRPKAPFLTLSRGLCFRNGETEASRVPSWPAWVGGRGPEVTLSLAPRLVAQWSVEEEEEAACERRRYDRERQLRAQDKDEGSLSPEQSEQEKL